MRQKAGEEPGNEARHRYILLLLLFYAQMLTKTPCFPTNYARHHAVCIPLIHKLLHWRRIAVDFVSSATYLGELE